MSNKNYIFETKDILGNNVKLKQDTWESHIINEHKEREYFKGNEMFFKEIVENPDYIFEQEAKNGKTRWNYTFYGNIKEEGNPKIYSVIVSDEVTHRDIVTMMPKSNTKLRSDEMSKEAKIYVMTKL